MDFSRGRTSSSKVLVRDSEGWYFAMNTEEVNAPELFTSRRGNDLVLESEDSSQRCGSTTDIQSVTSGDPVSPPVSPSVSPPISPPWESRTTTSENAARLSKEMDTPISLVELKPSMSDIDSRLLDQAMQNSVLVMETSFASPTMGTNFQQKDPLDGNHDTNGRSDDPGPRTWLVDVRNYFRRPKSVDDVRPYIILFHAISVSVSQLNSDGPENPEMNNDRFATFWNDVVSSLVFTFVSRLT
ncbi:hypothetical protein DFJ43DRAFT_1157296 [Lentinula guzmanii]|uniref:Uncharacterized protein n=1 Tax=Lentinula guzmanii TaxID=2804957 RepID=A0AA38J1U0_9AGAR|nr:hypothetical protein DFJ43DRAFT_1161847 [Lentinula guzmanii]KAJ3726418.1 hypothetical protein DFJ43DRAFT_1157296 [Lentinula guzmanii]